MHEEDCETRRQSTAEVPSSMARGCSSRPAVHLKAPGSAVPAPTAGICRPHADSRLQLLLRQPRCGGKGGWLGETAAHLVQGNGGLLLSRSSKTELRASSSGLLFSCSSETKLPGEGHQRLGEENGAEIGRTTTYGGASCSSC
jgi:hypothetical protein